MAWITSATNGESAPNPQLRSLQAVILVAHLALLIGLLFDRPTGHASQHSEQTSAGMATEMISGPANPAALALLSGMMLALLMVIRSRTRNGAAATGTIERQPAAIVRNAAPQQTLDANPSTADDGLLARLNHDLRTPLNAIIGFADLMKAEAFGPLGNDRYRAYAAHMQTCGHDLLRATESTIAMASLLANPAVGHDDTIDLAVAVDDAWRSACQIHPDAQIALDLTLDPAIRVRGNFPALRQSFVNLLGLARERSTLGSRIECGADHCDGRVQAWISLSGGDCIGLSPRTGCRSGAAAQVDELAIGVSRTLLALHDVALVETSNQPGLWTITMSLEDAAQADFFDHTAARQAGYSAAGFFGALPVSVSRSA